MGKKTLLILFGVCAVILSVLLLAPVFFNVDKILKPHIEKLIAQHLDVEARIGHLSLSLWGKVKVQVMGFELIDKQTQQSVFKVDEAHIEAPLMPLLDKTADLKFVTLQPRVTVVKEKTGGLNWARLVKSETANAAEKTGAPDDPTTFIPTGWTVHASIQVENANIFYKDLVAGTDTQVKDLDFLLADFSMDKAFDFKLTARLSLKMESAELDGPATVDGSLKFIKHGESIEGAELNTKVNLDKVKLKTAAFEKKQGEALNFSAVGSVLKNSARLKLDSNIESLVSKTNIDIRSFSPTVATFIFNAAKVDLDQLLRLEEQSGVAEAAPGAPSLPTSPSAKKASRKAAKASTTNVTGEVSVGEVIAKKVSLKGVTAKIHVSENGLEIKESHFKVFKGSYSGSISLQLRPLENKVSMRGKVSDIDINEAVVSQMPEFKDSIKGRLTSDYSFTTLGTGVDAYKKNLTGSGFFNLREGSWSALYGLKMLAEKLSSIPMLKDKVSGLKVGDKIETGRSNFRVGNGKIVLSETVLDMKDSRATVSGGGEIGFDKQLRFKGMLLVPLGSPPPALRSADGRAKLPFEFSGAINGPSVNWNVTTDAVAKAYLRQEGEKLLDQVKDSIKDENLKKILEQAPEGLDKLLKEIKF